MNAQLLALINVPALPRWLWKAKPLSGISHPTLGAAVGDGVTGRRTFGVC